MFNFSQNVGSNWGLPAGYAEMLAKAKSFNPVIGLGEAAVKYGEQKNKLSALQKGLSTTVSEYGKLAGLSKEQLAGFLTPNDNESRTDHIARLQAIADYLPKYMQKAAIDKQQNAANQYGNLMADFWRFNTNLTGENQRQGITGYQEENGFNALDLPQAPSDGDPNHLMPQ